jgi:hypothetical protein
MLNGKPCSPHRYGLQTLRLNRHPSPAIAHPQRVERRPNAGPAEKRQTSSCSDHTPSTSSHSR